MQTLHRHLIGLSLSLSFMAGCALKPTATLPPEPIYPTLAEAALGAWRFPQPGVTAELQCSGPQDPALFDRSATLKLYQSPADKTEVDLNGDGIPEVLLANGEFIDPTGQQTSHDGANNRSWAVLQKVPTGWRVLAAGFGCPCPPRVLTTQTHGWKDLCSGHHFSANSGSSHLYQFDGTRYQFTKETDYDFNAAPSPTTTPAQRHQQALSNPDWSGPLSPGIKIRAQANTWEELVATVKPTLTWGSPNFQPEINHGFPNLMWIQQDPNSQPTFKIAHAFIWQPNGQKPRWVLADFNGVKNPKDQDLYNDQVLGQPEPETLHVLEKIPNGDQFTSYAILKGTHPRGGSVYEIGWARSAMFGSGWWAELIPIFVWRNPSGTWQILGEGPNERREKASGGICNFTTCESTLQWQGTPSHPIIRLISKDSRCEVGENQIGLPELTTCHDAVLDGSTPPPAALHWENDIYIMAEKDDTLNRIAFRYVMWHEYHGVENIKQIEARTQPQQKALRQNIRHLNPNLPPSDTAPIPPGTRVIIEKIIPPTPSPK